ncbi:BTAD domain-containing putative transcriptional regulator [Streptomyces sp. V4-01]|uniref:BTAD domain-containing putative transcriptional regulator n=1 Tax=Actinacidiphila polyblastidii TaxID=3110430 RepID=A0ABU7PBI1_9ACTN|nr:BTAD domain-containing putative transcriptional regulator [Streptomyces sp. V4-01]
MGDEAEPRLSVRLLGPARAFVGAREPSLGPPLQRAVFAVLAVRRNQIVDRGDLIDAVWGEDLPSDPAGGLHTYVAGLRRVLDPGRPRRSPGRHLQSHPSGYRLLLLPEASDLARFEQLRDRGRAEWRAGRNASAERLLREALDLFEGPPLGGVPGPFAGTQRSWLTEQRQSVAGDRIDVLLAQGRDDEATDAARRLADEEPLRERTWAQLMLALYRDGRQADALASFDRARDALAEALGLDPGPHLGSLRQRIVASDPSLLDDAAPGGHAGAGPWSGGPRPVPDEGMRAVRDEDMRAVRDEGSGPARLRSRPGSEAALAQRALAAPWANLPRGAGHFVGREAEIRRIASVAERAGVCVIDGMAGVGKTTLAVHAARQLEPRYPDVRLYLDLYGHTPGRVPLTAAEALEKLLLAAGVPGERVPAELDDRAALWRSLLVGRRCLLVLDNVVDARQARPLLPGAAASLVLVTSRRRLSGLDAGEVLSLEMLSRPDAIALLGAVAGADRVAAEPAAADQVVRACGGLPLAVQIAAARLRHRPAWSLAHLRDRLDDEDRRLDELAAEDRSVAAAFALSYRSLEPAEQRTFRLLGLFPGTEIGLHAAAALAGTAPTAADRLLEGLVDCQLLDAPRPGRYRLHDLLKMYAARECRRTEHDTDRGAALDRLLDVYLAAVDGAEERLRPQRLDRATGPAGSGEPGDRQPGTEQHHAEQHHTEQPLAEQQGAAPMFADRDAALEWLDSERGSFGPLIKAAARAGRHRHAWQLARFLWGFYETRGHWAEWIACLELALPSARLLGDRLAEARLLVGLGVAEHDLRHYPAAVGHFRAALDLMRETGFRSGEAGVLTNLGNTYRRMGRLDEAIHCQQGSLGICRESADAQGEAIALANLGELYCDAAMLPQSMAALKQALAMFRGWDERRAEGSVLESLARAHLAAGSTGQALAHGRQALERRRTSGDRSGEAQTLDLLGQIHLARAEPESAVACWHQALAMAEELNSPLAAEIRTRLAAHPSGDPSGDPSGRPVRPGARGR